MPDSDASRLHAASSSESDLSGKQLGDFHLLRRLGRGAMADVYLAEQSRLKRRVAVKILRPELAGDRTYLQRFQIEAQAAASLIHANIVQIYEVGCVDRLHYIAQEYVQGENLREHVARHGPLRLPHALSIMRQVAAALAKAAEQGVVHRDIKPENIMLAPDGEVKVADFGLARLTREGDANELTQVGMTMGTPLYMSPEQVEGKSLAPPSDMYSFGVTCYFTLSGSPPFQGETALGVAVQHLKKQADPLESLRSDLPPPLCRLVHRMLAKDPSQRPTARELLLELRRLRIEQFGDAWPEELPGWDSLAGESTVDVRASATQQLEQLMKTTALRRTRRWHRTWIAAAVVAAFLFGAVIAWHFVVPPPLLADAKSEVPRQNNVWRQWYFANQIGTEEQWQSVIRYFPDKREFVLRAKQQLALIFIREGDLDQAMSIFEELAALDDDGELQAFGFAGQGVVLSLRGECRKSVEMLAQFWPLREKLKNSPMAELVAHAIRNNDARLGSESTQEWGKWISTQFPEGG